MKVTKRRDLYGLYHPALLALCWGRPHGLIYA